MNSTFRVVFNKARGALMVVNELTSSVQSKGTKTVVATATALTIASITQAAEPAQVIQPIPQDQSSVVSQNAVSHKEKTAEKFIDNNKAEAPNTTEIDNKTSEKVNADTHNGSFNQTSQNPVKYEDKTFANYTGRTNGGAIDVTSGTATFSNVNFINNKAQSQGGGLWLSTKAIASANNTNYTGNTALDNNGGGINIFGSGTYSQTDGIFSNNSAKKNGGAIAISDGLGINVAQVNIKNVNIENNTAGNGGALFLYNGTATFTDSLFSDNTARGWGGALYVTKNLGFFRV